MKKRLKILLSLLLVLGMVLSCGKDVCEGSDLSTKGGICIFSGGFDVDLSQVEYILKVTEQECQEKYKDCTPEKAQSQYSNTSISFLSEEEMLDNHDKYAFVNYRVGELIRDSFEVFIIHDECLTISALSHEIIHVINISIDGAPSEDGGSSEAHPVGWFAHDEYSVKENNNSIEMKALQRIYLEMCPGNNGFVTLNNADEN